MVGVQHHKVAASADGDLAGSTADGPGPGPGAAPRADMSAGAAAHVPLPRLKAAAVLEPAQLLGDAGGHMAVRADAEGSPGAQEGVGVEEAVAEIALRGRTERSEE